jgi:hypothetical protein
MTERRTIRGQDHWLYVGRISHDPNTGRPLLEVIGDKDEVLLRQGDEFCTFWAGQQLPNVEPTGPFAEPSPEAVALAEQIASEGAAGIEALSRAARIARALTESGLDADDPLVRLAAAVTLHAIAHELEHDDPPGDDQP